MHAHAYARINIDINIHIHIEIQRPYGGAGKRPHEQQLDRRKRDAPLHVECGFDFTNNSASERNILFSFT
jgi:hypothetical protein